MGGEGRDEDFENYRRMLANLGEFGIPLLSYNFIATIGWCRTAVEVPARGGACTNRFDLRELTPEPVPVEDRVTEGERWDNYRYFLDAILPAAALAPPKKYADYLEQLRRLTYRKAER